MSGFHTYGQAYSPIFTSLGVEQGLSQNTVFSVLKDRMHYLWISTGDGLNRYDGSVVKVYRIPSMPGRPAPSNLVRSKALEDGRGNIWFTTESGIFYVDYRSDSVVAAELFELHWNHSSAFDFQFIENGLIWFAHPNFGLGSYDIARHRFSYYPLPVKPQIHIPLKWRVDGQYPFVWYIEPSGKKVYAFDVRTFRYSTVFESADAVQFCAPGNDGALLCFDGRFVHRVKEGGVSEKLPVAVPEAYRNIRPTALVQDKEGRIWMGTQNKGLLLLDSTASGLRQFTAGSGSEVGLPVEIITALHIDASSMLHIGTDGGGLLLSDLKPLLFRLFPDKRSSGRSTQDYFIKSFYEDESRRIWCGTQGNGILIIDSNGVLQKIIGSIENAPLRSVGAIFRDRQNRLWIGHAGGIAQYQENTGRFLPLTLRIPDTLLRIRSLVFRFFQRSNGELLCASTHGLLRIFEERPGRFIAERVVVSGNRLPAMLTDLKELDNGDLLVAAPPFGLYRVSGNKGDLTVVSKYLENYYIRSICPDPANSNRFWLASESGLICFDLQSGRFDLYNERQGLLNEFLYGIVSDRRGNLWISTNNGLACFDTAAKSFRHYASGNGLQSREFNSGAYYTGSSGYVYFGGVKGFNWFNPDLFYAPRPVPSVALSGIQINGKPWVKDSTWPIHPQIRLSYNQNDIDLRFSALEYSNPGSGRVFYRLVGLHNEFLTAEGGEAHYRNISPGNYRLEYQSVNAWGDKSILTGIDILIQPPFWRTIWFYVLCGLALTGLLLFFLKGYARRKLAAQKIELQRQQELAEERLRISREMHDDIGAGLTRIALMSQTAEGRTENREAVLKDISETSRSLVQNMGEIIWSMNDENRTLEQLTAYLREKLHQLLEYSGIEYRLEFSSAGGERILTNSQRRNILLILKELVNNAIRHSGARNLLVATEIMGDTLLVRVEDDGKGYDAGLILPGNGLKNVRERLRKLGGSLTLPEGGGTSYLLRIPLN